MIKRIHHINFIVRDLTQAAARFGQLLGIPPGAVESLPHRGVELVRFKLAEVWLVLVQPTDPESVPGRYLAQRGEGFFLLSCEVDSLEASARELFANGLGVLQDEARHGLEGWRLLDLDPADFFGINIQLVESRQ